MTVRFFASISLAAAMLPAQQSFNVDFNGNLATIAVVGGRPRLVIYNLLPRTVQAGAPHHLVDFLRPGDGLMPLRIEVDQLWFYEPESCAWGEDVRLEAVQREGSVWEGATGFGRVVMHEGVDAVLQWQPGPASQAMGVLSYADPLQGCTPGVTPQSPAFAAVCSWTALPLPEIVQFSGFETGDFGEFLRTRGTPTVQSNVVRSGNRAMRCRTQDGYCYASTADNRPDGLPVADFDLVDLYASFWFRYDHATGRSRIGEVGGVNGATKARLELEVDRRLSIQDYGQRHRFYSQTSLAPDRWYHIRWYVGTGSVAGTELLIDNNVEISTSEARLSEEPSRHFHLGRSASTGDAIDFYFDDLIIARNGHPEDARIALLRPDDRGSHDDWSGSHRDLDEWPHDGDGTCSASAGNGSAMTVRLEDASAASVTGRVLAVKSLAVLRSDTTSTRPSAVRLRSASVDDDTATGDGGTGYRLRCGVYGRDPATGLPWSLSAIDDLEVGAVHAASSPATRMTAAAVAVLYVPQ